MFNH